MHIRVATAVKVYVLSCIVGVFIGCSEQQQSPMPSSDQRIEATPIPQTSASAFPPLNEQDLIRLDQRFPKRQRDVLQNAKHIDVYEIRDCSPLKGVPNGEGLFPIEKGKFQGCWVSRHAKVSDPEQRKELIEGILYSIGSSGNGNACFEPRHGIRAVHNGERIELTICFECENFRGAPESRSVTNFAGERVGPSENFSGGFSLAAQPLFERILSTASPKRR